MHGKMKIPMMLVFVLDNNNIEKQILMADDFRNTAEDFFFFK